MFRFLTLDPFFSFFLCVLFPHLHAAWWNGRWQHPTKDPANHPHNISVSFATWYWGYCRQLYSFHVLFEALFVFSSSICVQLHKKGIEEIIVLLDVVEVLLIPSSYNVFWDCVGCWRFSCQSPENHASIDFLTIIFIYFNSLLLYCVTMRNWLINH